MQWVAEHLEKYPESNDAEILRHAEVIASKEIAAVEIGSSNLPDQLVKLAKLIRAAPAENLASDLIGLICEKKVNEANDLLAKSSPAIEVLRQWPLKGLALCVYWKLCQFGKIVSLLQVNSTHQCSSC